jgi:hypothetical protein
VKKSLTSFTRVKMPLCKSFTLRRAPLTTSFPQNNVNKLMQWFLFGPMSAKCPAWLIKATSRLLKGGGFHKNKKSFCWKCQGAPTPTAGDFGDIDFMGLGQQPQQLAPQDRFVLSWGPSSRANLM